MRNFLLFCAALTMISGASFAAKGDLTESRERGFAVDKLAENEGGKQPEMRKRFEENMKNASPEEKARMEKRHEIMKNLTSAQREEVKKEMERHRAEMKRITGHDLMEHKPMSKDAGVY